MVWGESGDGDGMDFVKWGRGWVEPEWGRGWVDELGLLLWCW